MTGAQMTDRAMEHVCSYRPGRSFPSVSGRTVHLATRGRPKARRVEAAGYADAAPALPAGAVSVPPTALAITSSLVSTLSQEVSQSWQRTRDLPVFRPGFHS